MARKMTLESAIKQAKVDEIKAKQESERFNSLARIAIERFGENVTPEQFKEMLDTILINDEVREYIDSEKALINNPDK